MSRISEKFAELRAARQKALISYIMAGFPDQDATLAAVRGLVAGGADIIELGFPFSDPIADGPIIQNASTTSLQNGISMRDFLAMVRKIRSYTDIPLVMMTYTNIPYSMGYTKFIPEAKRAGIDAMILPDMSIEESGQYLKQAAASGMDTIFLISPNTSPERVCMIADVCTGFMYLVAVYGTTGTTTGVKRYTLNAINNVKKLVKARQLPVGVGFGVSTQQDVRRYAAAGADAIIVGSAYLRLIEKSPRNRIESRVTSYTKKLKRQTVL